MSRGGKSPGTRPPEPLAPSLLGDGRESLVPRGLSFHICPVGEKVRLFSLEFHPAQRFCRGTLRASVSPLHKESVGSRFQKEVGGVTRRPCRLGGHRFQSGENRPRPSFQPPRRRAGLVGTSEHLSRAGPRRSRGLQGAGATGWCPPRLFLGPWGPGAPRLTPQGHVPQASQGPAGRGTGAGRAWAGAGPLPCDQPGVVMSRHAAAVCAQGLCGPFRSIPSPTLPSVSWRRSLGPAGGGDTRVPQVPWPQRPRRGPHLPAPAAPAGFQGTTGLSDPGTVLEVRGQTYYIIVHLISCVLEKKV